MNPIEAFDKEVIKNYRFNFTVNLIDLAFYLFGYSFIAPAIILPVFVSHFTHNPILLGMIPFFSTAGFLVPQVFSSNLIERAPVKKFYPYNLGLFLERLPVFLLIAVTFFYAGKNSVITLILFFFLFAWHTSGAGFIMVGWQDMIAKIIPVEKRGRFFGVSNFIGNIAGLAGAGAVAQMLVRFPFPTGYVLAFTCASICILISWFFLGLCREPRDPVSKPVISHREYFTSLPQIIRVNRNFRNFLVTQIVSAFGAMAGGFIMVFALNRWEIPDGQAASYSIALLLGQLVANLILGFLADHKGHKIVLEISIIFNIAAFVLALVAPTPDWFFAVFALRGISLAGNFVSSMAFPLEFSEPQDRPTFIGLAGTIPGIAGALAPILGGSFAAFLGYDFIFVLSTGIAVTSFGLMHWWVREPRNTQSATRPLAQPGD